MTRIAIITGAGAGLGKATSTRLAVDGYHVICVGRSRNVEELADSLRHDGRLATAIMADVSDATIGEAMVEDVARQHGRIDVLVNNAGYGARRGDRPPTLDELTLEEWNEIVGINLTAPFVLSRAVVPHMRRNNWGRIINVSSRAGRTGVAAAEAAYSSTKAGLLGLTRYLAMTTANSGITANAIAAGRFGTDQANHIDPAIMAHSMAGIPVGRAGDPAEFAAMVAFLASDAAAFMTGATLDINGGAFMA